MALSSKCDHLNATIL